MKNKISIIMGIYNCEKYLAESIESILNQTYTNWELIMCDDGSKDGTLKLAKKYQKKYPDKIKVLVNEKNMGLNYTLNKCLKEATGEYIARQDGDDISLPERFEKEMEFLNKNKEYALVSSNMIFFDENGDWGKSHNFGEVKKENFIKGSPICHAPCIIRTDALRAVGGYSVDEKLLRVEDYHLWFKLFIAGYKCYSLEACLYKMRDDNDAYKRRNFKNRLNETRLKLWGFKKIQIPITKYIWAFKPIIAYIMPKQIYKLFHQKNLKMVNCNNRIKVAQFVGTMNCGGTETMLVNLLKNIDKDKYEFVFIENTQEKCWYDDEILKLGGKILRVKPFSFRAIFTYINDLKELFVKEQFDVVHSHVFLHSGLVMLAARKAKIKKRIAHSHSAMRDKDNNIFKLKFLRTLLLKNSTDLVACSTEAGVCLFGERFNEKGIVIPNPINLDVMDKITNKELVTIKKKYSLNDKEYIIGHVGRLIEIKNHKFMLELAKKLNEDGINFKMIFVGDGPEKQNIVQLIKKYGLEQKVILTGVVDNSEVYKLMKIFNLLLLPSIYEGLPVTLIEAQALNLYSIVSTNVSKESDLGINLMQFETVDNVLLWKKEILEQMKKVNVKDKKRSSKLDKYDSKCAAKEYEKIYINE